MNGTFKTSNTLSCLTHGRGSVIAKDLVAAGNTGAALGKRALTPAQYGDLADVPPELEWLAKHHQSQKPAGAS